MDRNAFADRIFREQRFRAYGAAGNQLNSTNCLVSSPVSCLSRQVLTEADGKTVFSFFLSIPSILPKKSSFLPANEMVKPKLTLPEQGDFYAALVKHLKVLKVVALSGRIFASGS